MTSTTLATKFGRFLISTLPPVVLLTMLSTVTNGQAIDKDTIDKDTQAKAISVKPQAKDISVKPQTIGTSAKPQTIGTSAKPQTIGTSAKPQTIGTSAKPQAKDTSVRPQIKATSAKPQAKANARLLSAGDASSQKIVDIEATSGSYRLVTGTIKAPSGALFLRIKVDPTLRCPEVY